MILLGLEKSRSTEKDYNDTKLEEEEDESSLWTYPVKLYILL